MSKTRDHHVARAGPEPTRLVLQFLDQDHDIARTEGDERVSMQRSALLKS